jgi:hypothetical protein
LLGRQNGRCVTVTITVVVTTINVARAADADYGAADGAAADDTRRRQARGDLLRRRRHGAPLFVRETALRDESFAHTPELACARRGGTAHAARARRARLHPRLRRARPPVRFRLGDRMHRIVQAHGPERIETAWWRGPSVRRDYYVVETESGERFWVFRRLRDGGWFFHGMFA